MQVVHERVLGRQTTLALTLLTSGAKDLPLALLLHGSERNRGVIAQAGVQLAERFDVVLCDLPGHGQSETPLDVSVDDYALEIVHLLLLRFPGRPVLIVGESISGVIALRAAADPRINLRWLALIDPPMTTAKQWHIRINAQHAMRKDASAFRRLFSATMFGVYEGERQEERIYYDLLQDLTVPCLILTGDLPLQPQRPMTEGVMCCLDATDLWAIQRFYLGKTLLARVKNAGHTVLVDQAGACVQTIDNFVRSHPTVAVAA